MTISKERIDTEVEPIAIIGIGCRFPGNVNSPEDFWEFLIEGKDGITEIPVDRWSKRLFYHTDKNRPAKIYTSKGGFLKNIDKFDPEFFGISPREASFMDPQQRLLLETTWESLEDAGINPRNLAGTDTGVFVGLFMHDYESMHLGVSERRHIGPHSATGMSTTLAANRISYIYDFRGPSMVIDTACSSSLVTIHLACQSLRNNESNIALAGGVNAVIKPETTMVLSKATMLSPDGYCKAFDSRANGYVRGEGAGLVVLKRLSKAIEDNDRIYAVIRSSATNQDGKSDGQTVPSREAQEKAIRDALKKARLEPKDIQYMEAHGTGTPVGDPIEANAIGTVLSEGRNIDTPCIMGSVKTNIGHTESAAGVAGVIKLALMLKNKQIPPNLHFENPNSEIDFNKLKLKVPTVLEQWETSQNKPRIAGVNSFGFGGSNAHALLEEYIKKTDKKVEKQQPNRKILIPLSGHTKEALNGVAKSYLDFLDKEKNKDKRLEDLGYTSALRKGEHNCRLTIVAQTKDELKDKLKAYIEGEKRVGMTSSEVDQDSKKIVFVFSGMGQQWWAMGRELLEEEVEFKKMVEKCDKIFNKYTKEWSLLEELKKDETSSRINETIIAQPAIFVLQVSLFELWCSRGITPDIIVGHSVGEVAAAYATGILSLEDAIRVCFHRSRLQQETAGQGKMLAVGLSVESVDKILELYKDTVSIAAINSSNSVTLSGDEDSLKDIESVLKDQNVFVRFLKVEVPYHSSVMDTILPELKESLKDIKPKKANIPLVSTVTGEIIDGEKINNQYWCENVRKPVYFHKAINQLIKTDHNIFIEIGAHPVLATSINETLSDIEKKAIVLPSLRRKETENQILLNSLGHLYCIGYNVNWNLLYKENHFIKLPCYAWQKDTYWNESDTSREARLGIVDSGSNIHPLIGTMENNAILPTWTNEIDLENLPYLKDHAVQGSIVCPAAAYIEMGIAVGKQRLGEEPFILEDITIKSPLLLKEDDSSTVKVILEKDNIFSVYSRSGNTWGEHINCKVKKIDKIKNDIIDIKAIKDRCVKEEKKEESYKRFHSLGLEYGPQFQALQHVWFNDFEILGEIKFTKEVGTQLNDYWIHPTILDACFQVMASVPVDGTYLPVKFEQIQYFKKVKDVAFGYAVIRKREYDKIIGDIWILDKQGNTVLKVQGLLCKYVDGTRKALSDSIDGVLYEYEWQLQYRENEKIGFDSCEHICSPGYIYDKVNKKVPVLIEQYNRNQFYNVIEKKIDKLCREYFITALNNLGFEFNVNDSFNIKDLAKKFNIDSNQFKLFNRILQILEEEKIIIIDSNTFKVLEQPKYLDPQKLWRKLIMEHPDQLAELTLIERCGSRLSGILQGKEDSLEVIFPPGSLVAEHLYHNSPTFRIYNRLVQESIHTVVDNLPQGRTLKVLEIGAGTGSLTSYVLPILPHSKTQYTFTDIGQGFLNQAKKNFKDYEFVEYKTLDIEKDILSQGFEPNSFDIILASDAIHATSNLENTLSNVKSCLRSNGILILLEASKRVRWFDLVWGTLKGWWLFSDYDIRPDYPTISTKKWYEILQKNNFSDVISLSDTCKNNSYEGLHGVFIARGPEIKAKDETVDLAEISSQDRERPWIILSDECGVSKELQEEFFKRKLEPIIIKRGDNFQKINDKFFIINTSQLENIQKLFKEIFTNLSNPPVIINMWNISKDDIKTLDIHSLKEITNNSCIEVLYIIKSLMEYKWENTPNLWFITNGTQPIESKKDLSLEQSPMWGLSRVLITEHTNLKTRIVDINKNPKETEIESLFKELILDDREDEIVLRDKKRYVHRLVRVKEPNFCGGTQERFSVYKKPSKDMNGFVFEENKKERLDQYGVELEVKALGLNFKDVLKVTGMLDAELTDKGMISELGLECSGIVTRIGKNVKNIKVGDEVLGLINNCLSNYAITDSRMIVHKPSHINFEEAATIPVVFMTAYYSLYKLAKIKKGDKILVHSATGGLGLAVIKIALEAGAEIFATAGNNEKRDFLRAIGVKYVGNSRTLDFYGEIMQVTKGEGLDIVVNTLSGGDAIKKSIDLLKPINGSFIEVTNIHNKTKLMLDSFKKGIRFYAFDLESMAKIDKEFANKLLLEVVEIFNNTKMSALPYRAFPLYDISGAFSYMRQAKHIGKIVLSMQDAGISISPTNREMKVDSNSTYLITGGLGGFGPAVAKWLHSCGAKNFVLCGRSGDSKQAAKQAVEELRNMGANVYVGKVDVTDREQVKNLIIQVEEVMPKVKGIIHAAMVLDDVSMITMKESQMINVMDPKILGAWNLHTQTLDRELDFFICFSSFTSIMGTSGQGNYAAGNYFLDLLCRYRRLNNLPGLSMSWGAMGEVGYVHEHENVLKYFTRMGVNMISLEQAWKSIVYSFNKDLKHVGIISVMWEKYLKYSPAIAKSSRFSNTIKVKDKAQDHSLHLDQDSLVMPESIEERKVFLLDNITKAVAGVLGMAVSKVNRENALDKYGLDSLMAVELNMQIKKIINKDLPKMVLLQNGLNIVGLVEIIEKELAKTDKESSSEILVSV